MVTVLVAGIGAFLGAYLKKKGENLASKENVDEVLKEVRAVTATTKKIEAEISNEVWDRQKRWKLRRDILFEAARKAGHEIQALAELHAIYTTEKLNEQNKLPPRVEKRAEVGAAWNSAAGDFEGMQLVINASCGWT
ncbi:MAG: hypothetical protein WAM58_00290 [Candidatus Acidiferrum sp.]